MRGAQVDQAEGPRGRKAPGGRLAEAPPLGRCGDSPGEPSERQPAAPPPAGLLRPRIHGPVQLPP